MSKQTIVPPDEPSTQELEDPKSAAVHLQQALDKVNRKVQEAELPVPHIGDIVLLYGRAWRLQNIKPRAIRLKLLPNKDQAQALAILQGSPQAQGAQVPPLDVSKQDG